MIEHLLISETLHKSGNPNQSVVFFLFVCVAGWGSLRYTLLCRSWFKLRNVKGHH